MRVKSRKISAWVSAHSLNRWNTIGAFRVARRRLSRPADNLFRWREAPLILIIRLPYNRLHSIAGASSLAFDKSASFRLLGAVRFATGEAGVKPVSVLVSVLHIYTFICS